VLEVYREGDLEVRPQDHLVLARGRALKLSVRELGVLVALVRRQDRVVTRDALFEAVWGSPLRADDRSVDVYIHKVRAKLAEALPEWEFIHTHFGIGYRFAPEPSFTGISQDGNGTVTDSGLAP
jgi:DNA-binding response OmpR family regulator